MVRVICGAASDMMGSFKVVVTVRLRLPYLATNVTRICRVDVTAVQARHAGWYGDHTTDRVAKADWQRDRLDSFWNLFANAFALFHAGPDPFLIRDIKPTNVSFDAGGFYLFDFNTAKSLQSIRKSKTATRLGNGSNRYTAPELLMDAYPDLRVTADYFGFATVFHRFATGRSSAVWSNTEPDAAAAVAVYAAEFDGLKVDYAAALKRHGYNAPEIDFLTRCLDPSAANRPKHFRRPPR